jgi:hypothetical protein
MAYRTFKDDKIETKKPEKLKVREFVDDALKEKCTAVKFCERLEVVGVKAIPNIAKTGKLNGFSFESGGIAFKGSQLGNNYKLEKLQVRGLDYDQERDREGLTVRKERFSREREQNRKIEAIKKSTKSLEATTGRLCDQLQPSVWGKILVLILAGVVGGSIAGFGKHVFETLIPPSEIQQNNAIYLKLTSKANPKEIELMNKILQRK